MAVPTSDNIPVTSLGGRMLVAVARAVGQVGVGVAYRPGDWFRETATVRRRKRWSRTARLLEHLGFIARHVDRSRNRVRRVALTDAGWRWVLEECGPGVVLSLDELACDADDETNISNTPTQKEHA